MVLLYSTDKHGSVYIKTDQLDGETDWKLRKAIPITQRTYDIADLLEEDMFIVANPPNDKIYDFRGQFQYQAVYQGQTEGLGLENTCWSGTVLASSGWMLG